MADGTRDDNPSWRRFNRRGIQGGGFERLVAGIQYKLGAGEVRRNERINGAEFDVTVRTRQHDGTVTLTVIECRARNRKLLVDHVRDFVTKAGDVGAARKIMVAAKGFSRGARQVAERHGIELWTVGEIVHHLPPHVVNVRTVHDYRVVSAEGMTIHRHVPLGFDTRLKPGKFYRDALGLPSKCLAVTADKITMQRLDPVWGISAVLTADAGASKQYVLIDNPDERRELQEFAESIKA